MAVVITEKNFEELVGNASTPVMLDFWAVWCGPCRAIAPIVEQLTGEYEGRVLIGKVDVEESPELANKFGITNIPTLLFFKDGKEVDKHVGSTTKSKIAAKLDALL